MNGVRKGVDGRMRLASLLLAAACGRGATATSTPVGPGCPDEPRIGMVSQDDVEGAPTWLLHERIIPDDSDGIFGGNSYGTRVIAEGVAARHGARTDERPVWIFFTDDAPACRGTPGRHLAMRHGDGAYFTEIAREVILGAGCTPPPEGSHFLALVAGDLDASCRFRARTHDAGRRDVEDPPLPPPEHVASIAAPLACEAPACELLWLEETMATGPDMLGVSEVITSAVQVVPGRDPCEWDVADAHTLILRPPGKPPRKWQEQGLWAILHDRRGVRFVLTAEPGVVELFAPGAGDAAPDKLTELVWTVPHEEDAAYYSLGPYCGP